MKKESRKIGGNYSAVRDDTWSMSSRQLLILLCNSLILWYKRKKQKIGIWSDCAMKDGRRFPRVDIITKYCLIGEHGAAKGKAMNISPVGVFVRTGEDMRVGDRVEINVYLPRYHGSVVSQAEVVWICSKHEPCEGPGVGLKWIDLSLLDVFRIDNFVRHWQEA
jgi:hypothetical protein